MIVDRKMLSVSARNGFVGALEKHVVGVVELDADFARRQT